MVWSGYVLARHGLVEPRAGKDIAYVDQMHARLRSGQTLC